MIGKIIGLGVAAFFVWLLVIVPIQAHMEQSAKPTLTGVVVGHAQKGGGHHEYTVCLVDYEDERYFVDVWGGYPCPYQVGDEVQFKTWTSYGGVIEWK